MSPERGPKTGDFEPSMDPARRTRLLAGWHRAVDRAKGWVEPSGNPATE